MAPPNAACILQSEVSILFTALKTQRKTGYRGNQIESRNSILKSFEQLKVLVNHITDIKEIQPLSYLAPFLEVIRSEDTTGQVTSLALTSVEKFLSYGFLEFPEAHHHNSSVLEALAQTVEAIADAGTQARFMGIDRSSDEIVLMKVLNLLRTLLLVPAGILLSDRVVREILHSCFRICLEPKLSDLLRCFAEQCLCSMVQLFFSRLPYILASFQSPLSPPQQYRSTNAQSTASEDQSISITCMEEQSIVPDQQHTEIYASIASSDQINNKISTHHHQDQIPCSIDNAVCDDTSCTNSPIAHSNSTDKSILSDQIINSDNKLPNQQSIPAKETQPPESNHPIVHASSYSSEATKEPSATVINQSLQPYGLATVHDLLHYLIGLLTPGQQQQRPDRILPVALNLVSTAFETGADTIGHCPTLLALVQNDLTKNLLSLLHCESDREFVINLKLCFMLFESLRGRLKLQMEIHQLAVRFCHGNRDLPAFTLQHIRSGGLFRNYLCLVNHFIQGHRVPHRTFLLNPSLPSNQLFLQRLLAICSPENESIGPERREIGLDFLVRLLLVPGLASELYVNYDCDPHCSNLFEEMTKMLAKNAYPVDRLTSSHLMSLDALLAILNTIGVDGEGQCDQTDSEQKPVSRLNRHLTNPNLIPSKQTLLANKNKKKLLITGSDYFNAKPSRGIAYLQECGILSTPLDPNEVAVFLRENPRLEKQVIGDFISNKKNTELLLAFVNQFNFINLRIDEALRFYLEAFRLPGEAALIDHVLDPFANHCFTCNPSQFANPDAAFTLSYAILMLNVDQHNPVSKKQNLPMKAEQFKRNLKGMNGGDNFDDDLLLAIYKSIHDNEIVMPNEQTGLARENYLWKCLLRRSQSDESAPFVHLNATATHFDAELFDLVWGPTVSALSYIFDKSIDSSVLAKSIDGFVRCARLAAFYGASDLLDNMVISLCKFTSLLTSWENPSLLPAALGRNSKACLAIRLVFDLACQHADIVRYGWHSIIDCLIQLFRANLLPRHLIEFDDLLAESRRIRVTVDGCIVVALKKAVKPSQQANSGSGGYASGTGGGRELGMLSSFYHYITAGSGWSTSSSDIDEDEDDSNHSHDVEGTDSIGRVTSHRTVSSDLYQDYLTSILSSIQLDDEAAGRACVKTIDKCQVDKLLKETKFLVDLSLCELIKALLRAVTGDQSSQRSSGPSSASSTMLVDDKQSHSFPTTHHQLEDQSTPGNQQSEPPTKQPPTAHLQQYYHYPSHQQPLTPQSSNVTTAYNQHLLLPEPCRIFCFELLLRILVYNRDRLSVLWPLVQGPLVDLLLTSPRPTLLVERACIGLLRLASCHIGRHQHELTWQLLACLRYVLLSRGDSLLKPLSDSSANASSSTNRHRQGSRRSRGRGGSTVNGVVRLHANVAGHLTATLADILRSRAADLPQMGQLDWQLLFTLLDVTGAGLRLASLRSNGETSSSGSPDLTRNQQQHYSSLTQLTSLSSSLEAIARDCMSDTEPPDNAEQRRNKSSTTQTKTTEQLSSDSNPSWILVDKDTGSHGSVTATALVDDHNTAPNTESVHRSPALARQKSADTFIESPSHKPNSTTSLLVPASLLKLDIALGYRDSSTLEQAFDCLTFLIRDPAHITPINFEYCINSLRVFAEACLRHHPLTLASLQSRSQTRHSSRSPPVSNKHSPAKTDRLPTTERIQLAIEARLGPVTNVVAIQLLDLASTLFNRSSAIIAEWQQSPPVTDPSSTVPSQWAIHWLPLLQSMARLCLDCRSDVRLEALTCLQRALLSPILGRLDGPRWQECFDCVLFPLLTGFMDSIALEEAMNRSGRQDRQQPTASGRPIFPRMSEVTDPRMRVIPMLTKIFLQHLHSLSPLSTFSLLWQRILLYMKGFMQVTTSDSLADAVRESLKNVLLVMYTTTTSDSTAILVRDAPEGSSQATFWQLTASQLQSFLPDLLDQLFPPPPPTQPPALESTAGLTSPDTIPIDTSPSPSTAMMGNDAVMMPSQSFSNFVPPRHDGEIVASSVPIPLPNNLFPSSDADSHDSQPFCGHQQNDGISLLQ